MDHVTLKKALKGLTVLNLGVMMVESCDCEFVKNSLIIVVKLGCYYSFVGFADYLTKPDTV